MSGLDDTPISFGGPGWTGPRVWRSRVEALKRSPNQITAYHVKPYDRHEAALAELARNPELLLERRDFEHLHVLLAVWREGDLNDDIYAYGENWQWDFIRPPTLREALRADGLSFDESTGKVHDVLTGQFVSSPEAFPVFTIGVLVYDWPSLTNGEL